jgi:hypothetical protein
MEGMWNAMNLHEVQSIARAYGLPNAEQFFTESGVIRAIQKAQGREPCFRSDDNIHCPERNCEFRKQCLKLTAAWRS